MPWFLVVMCLLAAGCGKAKLTLHLSERSLPADGYSSAEISVSREARLRIVEGSHSARIEGTRLIAGIVPGRVVVEGSARGSSPVRVALQTTPVWTDRFKDGTPDFLRLDDPGDVETFRGNARALSLTVVAPVEITDCSSFIRYVYREALRGYEGRTAAKYQFPWTPLGARIFRVSDGYTEFVDAQTLLRHNTHFVSRDVRRAAVGDLLFFRQPDQKSPWHVMMVCGPDRVCYHTGPSGTWKGEIRRPTLNELQRNELPKWRPLVGNSNFLGVYRWNILRQES